MQKADMVSVQKPARPHELGAIGEEIAAAFLAMRGIRAIEKRFRRRGGEIDLVCRDECAAEAGRNRPEIVFVEVKTRSNLAFGRPEAGLSRDKKERILHTAEQYLYEHDLLDCYARIDVVSILFDGGLPTSIRHYVDAIGSTDLDRHNIWNERMR
jgi:putative endonuclease